MKYIITTRPSPPLPLALPAIPTIGAGDVVAALAQPIARAIDALAGTSLAECGGCAARKAALNSALPDILKPFK